MGAGRVSLGKELILLEERKWRFLNIDDKIWGNEIGEEDFRKEHERRFSSYIISRCGNEVLNEAKKNNRDG